MAKLSEDKREYSEEFLNFFGYISTYAFKRYEERLKEGVYTSYKDFAEKVGGDVSSTRRFLKGTKVPSIALIFEVLKELNISLIGIPNFLGEIAYTEISRDAEKETK